MYMPFLDIPCNHKSITSHANGYIYYCVSGAPWQGLDVSLEALPPHAVHHRNLCAPPAEGEHFYCKLNCSSAVSFPTWFFDSLLLTSQSRLWHDWYDSTNALTWPLSERLTRSWTWHRGDGLVFFHILSNVFPSPRAPANNILVMPENLSSSWAGARGLCAEIWQASFIAWLSACWLHECIQFGRRNMGGSFLREGRWICKRELVLWPRGGVSR